MFAISYDLSYWETQAQHPKGLRQAYRDIEKTLGRYGFVRVQQSVYLTDNDNLANLLENWSDFTPSMKGSNR